MSSGLPLGASSMETEVCIDVRVPSYVECLGQTDNTFSLKCYLVSLVTQPWRIHLPMQQTVGLISGSGRYPGEGNGNPLQCACLGNPMDRGAWQASPWGCKRVEHDLATEQREKNGHLAGQPSNVVLKQNLSAYKTCILFNSYIELFFFFFLILLWHVACKILIPWPGTKPVLPAVAV